MNNVSQKNLSNLIEWLGSYSNVYAVNFNIFNERSKLYDQSVRIDMSFN